MEKLNYDESMTEMSFNRAGTHGQSGQGSKERNNTEESYLDDTFANAEESVEKRIMRNKLKQARMVKILKQNSYGERSNSKERNKSLSSKFLDP